jgi:hypothetical protein
LEIIIDVVCVVSDVRTGLLKYLIKVKVATHVLSPSMSPSTGTPQGP